MVTKEQAEEVCWLLCALHLCIWAEVWRVELTRVRQPNDVVKEADEQRDGVIMI